MQNNTHDFTGLVAGILKFIEPTGDTDSSKRKIWKAECVCGSTECGIRSDLEKYAGLTACPGHPLKGHETPVEGFKISANLRDMPEQVAALVAWEAARSAVPSSEAHPTIADDTDAAETNEAVIESPAAEGSTIQECEAPAVEAAPVSDASPAEAAPEVPAPKKERKPVKGSAMLKARLGLDGYVIESVKLPEPLPIQGLSIAKAVFAKSIHSDDRVFLHIESALVDGKAAMISSRKRILPEEWKSLTSAFEALKLTWREKPMKAKK